MNLFCPYLGTLDDPHTSKSFPDSCHTCHQADPPRTLILEHQRKFCLTQAHQECNGYKDGWAAGFPKRLQNKNCRKPSPVNISTLVLIGTVLLALGVFLVIGLVPSSPFPPEIATLEGGFLIPEATHTPTPDSRADDMFLPSSPTSTSMPSDTPTPAATPTHTPGPALLTPFGSPGLELLIYEVVEGDSYGLIASRHNTTEAALRALNVRTTTSLWIGDILVVCVNCDEAPDLPPLQPRFLELGITLSELAAQYDTPAEDLRLWNGLGDDDWIEGGRWVVVRDGGT